MADKDREDDKVEVKTSLTPEQRIEKLEKGKTLSTVLIVVLALLSIAELAGLGFLMMAPADQRPGENAAQLVVLETSIREMKKAESQAEQIILQSQVLQTRLDKVLADADINNFASLRVILTEQEQSYSDFIRSLQQGMYEISRMVRGSRTWYEVYKEDLDKILQASDSRQSKLEALKPGSNPLGNQ